MLKPKPYLEILAGLAKILVCAIIGALTSGLIVALLYPISLALINNLVFLITFLACLIGFYWAISNAKEYSRMKFAAVDEEIMKKGGDSDDKQFKFN